MVLYDFQEAYNIVDSCSKNPKYSEIYYSSNEHIDELFKHVSIEGKDVFTVLASSDQLFHVLSHNAKSVDTYDINQLTKYYYYLRRWALLEDGLFYPLESITKDHDYIFSLLQRVKPATEEEWDAYTFWRLFIQNVFPNDICKLFFLSHVRSPIDDISSLKEIVKGYSLSFQLMDLFQKQESSKKYDLIITSNILEYGRYNSSSIASCRDNLYDMLKDDGKVLCSHFICSSKSVEFMQEVEMMRRCFQYEELPYYYDEISNKECPLGYVYTKK